MMGKSITTYDQIAEDELFTAYRDAYPQLRIYDTGDVTDMRETVKKLEDQMSYLLRYTAELEKQKESRLFQNTRGSRVE
jgi:hypothetical protein